MEIIVQNPVIILVTQVVMTCVAIVILIAVKNVKVLVLQIVQIHVQIHAEEIVIIVV